jgi:hypothetical protein
VSTDPLDLLYADLARILMRMAPQTNALARHERCTGLLQRSARELATNPQLAVDELGPQGARAFARALRAVGQQHVAVAERIDELAAEAETAAGNMPGKAGSGTHSTGES